MDKKQIIESLNFIFNEGEKWNKIWDATKKIWVKNKKKIKYSAALAGTAGAAYQAGKYGGKGLVNKAKNSWNKNLDKYKYKDET